MADREFPKRERRLAKVEYNISALQVDVAVLKTDVAELKTDVAELKTDVAELKTDVAELRTDFVELRRHMGVLHEDVIDRIKAIGEHDALGQAMRAGFAQVHSLFHGLKDQVGAGDAADRHFATTLDDHEGRIRTLESR